MFTILSEARAVTSSLANSHLTAIRRIKLKSKNGVYTNGLKYSKRSCFNIHILHIQRLRTARGSLCQLQPKFQSKQELKMWSSVLRAKCHLAPIFFTTSWKTIVNVRFHATVFHGFLPSHRQCTIVKRSTVA